MADAIDPLPSSAVKMAESPEKDKFGFGRDANSGTQSTVDVDRTLFTPGPTETLNGVQPPPQPIADGAKISDEVDAPDSRSLKKSEWRESKAVKPNEQGNAKLGPVKTTKKLALGTKTEHSARKGTVQKQDRVIPEKTAGEKLVAKLMSGQRKLIKKREPIEFFRVPSEDFLKDGPLGINTVTLENVETSVAMDVVPVFILTTMSYFASLGYLFTQKQLDIWEGVRCKIERVCGLHDGEKAKVIKEIDIAARSYSVYTFFKIHKLKRSLDANKGYGIQDAVNSYFEGFYNAVEIYIVIADQRCMALDEINWAGMMAEPAQAQAQIEDVSPSYDDEQASEDDDDQTSDDE